MRRGTKQQKITGMSDIHMRRQGQREGGSEGVGRGGDWQIGRQTAIVSLVDQTKLSDLPRSTTCVPPCGSKETTRAVKTRVGNLLLIAPQLSSQTEKNRIQPQIEKCGSLYRRTICDNPLGPNELPPYLRLMRSPVLVRNDECGFVLPARVVPNDSLTS